MAVSAPSVAARRVDWVNVLFLTVAHVLALLGIFHLVVDFHAATLVLAVVCFFLCGLSITGGYHRLFSHPTYKANALLETFYLLFGAASVQNSALKWSADHRRHHANTDTDKDPYDINRGFLWAHVGWVLFKDGRAEDYSRVPDLAKNPRVAFQHRWYIPLAIVFGGVFPTAIAALWGDALGGFLVAGFLRLVFQYHATFSINSFAHKIGTQPYSDEDSARDSWITALVSMGEGYHNYHHCFPADYRNGVRAWQFDPTKWFVWSLSKVGVTRDLTRVPTEKREARMRQRRERREASPAA
jgi:stearoyl-CoA desaturase (delta-9 desaturase)